MMSKNSIVPFLKDYLINFFYLPFLLDTNEINYFKFLMPFILVLAANCYKFDNSIYANI